MGVILTDEDVTPWMDRRREGAHETGCEGGRGGLKDGLLVGSSNGQEGERERQWM